MSDEVTADTTIVPVQPILQVLKPYLELLGVAGILAIPLSAIRVLEVAGWNRETAVALLANSNTTLLALTLLVLAVPLAGAFWITKAVIDALAPEEKGWVGKALVALALVGCNTMIGLTWYEILAYAVVPAVFTTVMCVRTRGHGMAVYRHVTRDWQGGFAILLTVAAFALAGSMWLPPERLVIDGKPTLGYVLKSEDDDYIVFLEEGNLVSRMPKSKIQERQYCTIATWNPIRQNVTGLPRCPGIG